MKDSCLHEIYEANEKRTEPYSKYGEGVSEFSDKEARQTEGFQWERWASTSIRESLR
ncbi:MAG: hypothetical protein KGI50_00235 [Patescibacteria group bacterium]|nr:hypothetical protein [Patescibacteria group bacterium]